MQKQVIFDDLHRTELYIGSAVEETHLVMTDEKVSFVEKYAHAI